MVSIKNFIDDGGTSYNVRKVYPNIFYRNLIHISIEKEKERKETACQSVGDMSVYSSYVSKVQDQYSHHGISESAVKEMSELVCPISLYSVKETDNILDWISVPTGQPHIFNKYSVESVHEYAKDRYWLNVRDPLNRNVIDFMKSRVMHLYDIKSKYYITTKNVTHEYRLNLLDQALDEFQQDDISEKTADLGLLINIRIWFEKGLLHTKTQHEAENFLFDKEERSFLLRKSSHVIDDAVNSPFTIFTISYKKNIAVSYPIEQTINGVVHERYIYINAVGLYQAHYDQKNTFWSKVAAKDAIDVLKYLSHSNKYPLYTCVMDLLLKHARSGKIQLSKML